ncbi:STAS domain protein [Maioricimonas rarisocia]|uniref:STAS domain protein n=1 Tax=Maioricimonas rarisocia TaxID=2528026 RepID=A0A517ZCV8_9PLAN|nr:STAS domain-containing protein [Maioricimonas rarisocia]QDU40326.1 STAS domain protein [Maioricimonas rarisocia]
MASSPDIQHEDGVTVVVFGQDFDSIGEDRIDAVADVLTQAAAQQTAGVVIDLSHTSFFGSSFIEQLFRLWNRMKKEGQGRFAICGLQPYCREVLEVTNLHQLWILTDTRAEAIHEIKNAEDDD